MKHVARTEESDARTASVPLPEESPEHDAVGETGEAGDAADPSSWELGTPDLIVEMADSFELYAEGRDIIRNFVLPLPEANGQLVRAVELDPGNRRVVHHANILADTKGRARALDRDDPEPGYAGMVAAVAPGGHFLGWTPGKRPRSLPEGTAWRVERDTDVVLQLHMMPTGQVESVRPRIALYFTNEEVRREPVVLHLGSTAIDLPPETRGTAAEDRWTVPYGFTVAAIYPHAHYLGESVRLTATLPDGTQQTILDIPRWDFFWQDEYVLKREQPYPANTELHLRISYDNTSQNKRNPFQPPQRVLWGPNSQDEMCDIWLTVFPANPSDLPLLKAATIERSLQLSRDGMQERARSQDTSSGWAALARLDLELGNFEQALEGFSRAEQLTTSLRNTGTDGRATAASHHLGQIQHDRGLAMVGLGRHGDAIEAFQRAIVTLGSPADENESLIASSYANLGTAHLIRNELEEAESSLTSTLKLDPDDTDSLVRLGLVMNRQGKLDDAERRYRQALAADPDHIQAHATLGALQARRGAATEGRRHLLRAIELDPLQAEAHKNLATLAALQGDLNAARGQLERAIEIDPIDAVSHHLLGVTAIQLGDTGQAHKSLEEAVRLDPNHSNALRDLATLLALEEKHDEARPLWERAVQANPRDIDAVGGLADSLVRRGRLNEARRLLEGTLSDLGDAPALADLLRQLEQLAPQP